jgi:hypothetical protein
MILSRISTAVRPTRRKLGTVRSAGRDGLVVEIAGGRVSARRADGCLLEPEVGDEVVLLESDAGVWISDVLERAGSGAAVLAGRGDVSLSGRTVTIAADGPVNVAAQGVGAIAAGTARIEAKQGAAHVARVTMVAGVAEMTSVAASLFAKSIDVTVERARALFGALERRVLGVDRVRAREVDMAAIDSAAVRGRATMVRAEGTVSAQGEPVQFG